MDHTIRFWKGKMKLTYNFGSRLRFLIPNPFRMAVFLEQVPVMCQDTGRDERLFPFLQGAYSQGALYKALRILVGREERGMGGREKDFSQMVVKWFGLRDQLSG